MDVIFDRVAGLDIGKKSVVACVRTPGELGRRVSQIRTFRTMTRHVEVLGDPLVEEGVFGAGRRYVQPRGLRAGSLGVAGVRASGRCA